MKRRAILFAASFTSLLLNSCGSYSPDFNILGSHFPAWMLCAVLGIVIAVFFSVAINRLQWQEYVRPPVLTYPCTAVLVTFSLWLIFFT